MSIRFGFLGTGYWGEEVHLPTLSTLKGAELVGIWGRNDEKARALAEKFGVSAFDRFDDLMARVDAVAIAVAPEAQGPLAIRAAEAGKHLFLEKPIATSTQDAQRLAAAAKRHGISSVVFFMRRFVPAIESDIQAFSRKTWHSCRVRLFTGAMVSDSPYEGSKWRQIEGAALWDNGPHVLSILLPILGPVRNVSAKREGRLVYVATRHARGATTDIVLTLHAAPSEVVTSYEFSGPSGIVNLAGFTSTRESRRQACARAISDLLQNISKGEMRHRCDVRIGALGAQILSAAQRSIGTGRPVDI